MFAKFDNSGCDGCGCVFYGHYDGFDIYTTEESLVARFSDDPCDYASMPKKMFEDSLARSPEIVEWFPYHKVWAEIVRPSLPSWDSITIDCPWCGVVHKAIDDCGKGGNPFSVYAIGETTCVKCGTTGFGNCLHHGIFDPSKVW